MLGVRSAGADSAADSEGCLLVPALRARREGVVLSGGRLRSVAAV